MLSKDGEGKCVPEEVRGELERFEREFETGVYREGNRERVLSRGRFRGRVVSGKTDDEVETDIKEFTCGVFEEYAKRDTVPEGHTFGGKVVDPFKEEA